MPQNPSVEKSRRAFLKSVLPAAAGAAALGALSPSPAAAAAQATLQVWSCGGLAEAMMPANQAFEDLFGVKIIYTGAFAAALGKSLMGNGRTEVFAGRVLDLAKNLRKAGRMRSFIPLCYTSYVIVTPKGNPAGIKTLEDVTRPGVRVPIAQQASAPGGADLMNCIAMIPVPGTRLASATPPDAQKMNALRLEAGAFIKQMRHCARCRADAADLLDSSTKLSDFGSSGYQLPPI